LKLPAFREKLRIDFPQLFLKRFSLLLAGIFGRIPAGLRVF